MGINKVTYKSETPATPEQSPTTATPVTTTTTTSTAPSNDKIEQLIIDDQKIVSEIDEALKWKDGLTADQIATLKAERAIMLAEIARWKHYLETGELADSAYSTNSSSSGVAFDLETVSGWIMPDHTDPTKVNQIKPIQNADGTYTIKVDDDPLAGSTRNPITFMMESSDDASKDMVKAEGKNRGNDVAVTITFRDGHTEVYIIKDAAKRPDIQICINALKSTHEVGMFFQDVYQVNPKTGATGGVYLIGSKNNDVIYGSSSGGDLIEGAGGNDVLVGMGKNNDIQGFADAEDIAKYGADLGSDGDDTIYDMTLDMGSSSHIDGGQGDDTVIREFGAVGETASHVETDNAVLSFGDPTAIQTWFKNDGWTPTVDPITGELVLTQDADKKGDTISLTVEDGYMASFSKDPGSDDLIVNMVKPGDGTNPPTYYRARIKGYFAQENTALVVNGRFATFDSAVNVGVKSVTLNGSTDGGDILVGPRTSFEDYGIDSNNLGKSSVSDAELQAKIDAFKDPLAVDAGEEPFANATVVDGKIVIEESIDSLTIPTSYGGEAFVRTMNDGSIEITVVQEKTQYSSQSIVIVVKNPGDGLKDMKNIKINGVSAGSVHYVGKEGDPVGVTINGGSGIDFMAGYDESVTFAGESSSLGIEIKHASKNPNLASPTDATLSSVDKTLAEINGATTAEQLATIKAKVEKMPDSDSANRTKLLNAIDTRCSKLITEKISGYTQAYIAANPSTGTPTEAQTKALADLDAEISKLIGMISNTAKKATEQAAYTKAQEDAKKTAPAQSTPTT